MHGFAYPNPNSNPSPSPNPGQVPSLQATCAHWLHETMSKDEQCSDWGARPLSGEQMRYAATDAAACLRVLEVLQEDWRSDQADAEPLHERLRRS